MTTRTTRCLGCRQLLEEAVNGGDHQPCPSCGDLGREIAVVHTEGLEIHDGYSLRKEDPSRSRKKRVRMESFSKLEVFHREGRLVRKERLIDRDADRYREMVVDPVTGEVIHHTDEPLSNHRGHGSARRTSSRREDSPGTAGQVPPSAKAERQDEVKNE